MTSVNAILGCIMLSCCEFGGRIIHLESHD